MMSADPYAVLGLNDNASKSDIRLAFRRLAKKYHPDVNHGDKAAEDHFKRLTAAYDELTGKTPGSQELAPPPRYDYQYLSELEERVRAQRSRTKKPGGVMGNISSFLKTRFKA
jgi:DnaJ-class molecular chaperone